MTRIDANVVVKLRELINPIIALIDPSFEILVKYSCLICGGSIFNEYIDKYFVQALRQAFLDLYTLYSSYVPWLLIDEIRMNRGNCPIIRSSLCNKVSYNLNLDKKELVISVDCNKIHYRCVFRVRA